MKCLILWMLYHFIASVAQQVTVKKKVDTNPVIIDGKLSQEGNWPWMVFITATQNKKIFNCGGMLINKYWVLTAAHCLYINEMSNKLIPIEHFELRIGTVDNEKSGRNAHISAVSKYIHHPDFVMTEIHKKDNDIALLKMVSPVPDEIFEPITIGPPDIPRVGDLCMSMGWGCDTYGLNESTQKMLYEISLPVISLDVCSRNFSELCYGNWSTKICAGYFETDKGICPGDSGGPLICRFQLQWVLSGVTSFTLAHLPAIFTKVSCYEDWIKETLYNEVKESSGLVNR